MNTTHFASDLATVLHRERIDRRNDDRLAAAARRLRRADRLNRRAITLAKRAAALVEQSHR